METLIVEALPKKSKRQDPFRLTNQTVRKIETDPNPQVKSATCLVTVSDSGPRGKTT